MEALRGQEVVSKPMMVGGPTTGERHHFHPTATRTVFLPLKQEAQTGFREISK